MKAFGIDIHVHWTFLLLIFGIVGFYLWTGQTLYAALAGVGFVLAIFACVVLHELGHALVAKRYGVQTRDITLLPIGGLARLQRMPEHPMQEFLVAVAGPAVNVVIAGILLAILVPTVGWSNMMFGSFFEGNLFVNLMWANVILVAFNLLPAFPMDGGRALRALLATQMDYSSATSVATSLGQVMAVLFGLVGLLFNPILVFIAIFVYLGAGAEARMVHMRMILENVPLREAMITEFRTLSSDDSMDKAVDELLSGEQQDFPVVDDGQFRGMVFGEDLIKRMREGDGDVTVKGLVRLQCHAVDERDMLDRTFREMQEGSCSSLPVLRDDQVVGLITMSNLGQFIALKSALGGRPPRVAARKETAPQDEQTVAP